MHTTATLHVHPAVADIERISEIRRLARDTGCRFISSTRLRLTKARPITGPWGGDAA